MTIEASRKKTPSMYPINPPVTEPNKDRKDESIAMRIKKKRTKKQLKDSRDESYGKFGSKAKKSGKINK